MFRRWRVCLEFERDVEVGRVEKEMEVVYYKREGVFYVRKKGIWEKVVFC